MLLNSLKPRIHAVRNSLYPYLLFSALAICSPEICFAQQKSSMSVADSTSSKFQIGVSSGISINKFSGGQPQMGQNTGFTAGVSLHYRLYHNLGVQIEANILRQGGTLLTFKDDTRVGMPESFATKNVKNSSVNLNGVEVPLLVRYVFGLKQAWAPALYLGGSFIYNYNATDRYQKTGDLLPGKDVIATVSDFQNVTSEYKAERINVIVGADVQMPLFNAFKLSLDFRYLKGLSAARSHYSYMEKIGFGSNVRTNSFISKLGIVMPLTR